MSLVVILSLLPYVRDLGFYGTDWYLVGCMSLSEDQSLSGLFQASTSDRARMRPLQTLYTAGLFWLFGSQPLGYHLVNAVVLMANAALFYLVLRLMNRRRVLCLAAAAAYALLPHYSTARFWLQAFAGNLSVTFYFLSLYSDLRALSAEHKALWGWKLLSLSGLVASTLLYEVALPLFLLNPLFVWYRGRQMIEHTREGRVPFQQLIRANFKVLLGINLLALVPIMVFKLLTTTRIGMLAELHKNIFWMIKGAFAFDYSEHSYHLNYFHALTVAYGDHGLRLPTVVWKILHDHPAPAVLAMAVALGLFIFAYLYLTADETKAGHPSTANMVKFIKWGLAVFGLGYAIFLTNHNVQFTNTGMANRTAIAAAIGVALTQIGALGWLSTLFSSERWRKRAFGVLVALFCSTGFLINNTLASFWSAASRQQQLILVDLRKQFPALPGGSTLILDGVCPYIGPASVFESGWELVGALMMIYRDKALQAEIATPKLKVTPNGLVKSQGGRKQHYPYEKLFVYDFEQKKGYKLTDAETARRYFQASSSNHRPGCPESHYGFGVAVF